MQFLRKRMFSTSILNIPFGYSGKYHEFVEFSEMYDLGKLEFKLEGQGWHLQSLYIIKINYGCLEIHKSYLLSSW